MQQAYTDFAGAFPVDVAFTEAAAVGKLELLVGEQVFRQLAEEAFLTAWDVLYQACPWATIFQSRAFVCSAYQIYGQRQLPILVKAQRQGQLTGLLALSCVSEALITGAGEKEAGYHAWLAEPLYGEAFIKAALACVKLRFPRHKILFDELPPQVPLAWVEADPDWKPCCVLQAFRRPLMNLRAPDTARLLSSNGIQQKVSRLSKLGDVRFERIADRPTFLAVRDQLNDQFDFRKGAMLHLTPFRSDPAKQALQLALFESGLLYVGLLKVGGEIIASIQAMIGREGWLHGMLNTHAPSYGKYSPGIVSFLLLAQYIYEEGFAGYDLTTGGHGYKERLANDYDQVYVLQIGDSRSRLAYELQTMVVKQLKKRFESAGIVPRTFRNHLSAKWAKLRTRYQAVRKGGLALWLQQLADKPLAEPVMFFFHFKEQPAGLTNAALVRRNSLADLLCFTREGELQSRWEFWETAEKRLQAGERAFTLTEAGCLLCCGWVAAAVKEATVPPAGAVLLQGLYCHRQGLHRLEAFLEEVARQVQAPLYIAGETKLTCRHLEKAGLRRC